MSYLHCPTCRCAYNIATQPRCPRCNEAEPPVDAAQAIVAALDELARAMMTASPEEMARVHAALAQRSLPGAVEDAVILPEPSLAITRVPPVERRLVAATRRLRSWTKARLAAPMQRARALFA